MEYQDSTLGSSIVKWLLIIIFIYAFFVIFIHLLPGVMSPVTAPDNSSSISAMVRQ